MSEIIARERRNRTVSEGKIRTQVILVQFQRRIWETLWFEGRLITGHREKMQLANTQSEELVIRKPKTQVKFD